MKANVMRLLYPLVGAAIIVGCIDEDPQQAQAFTRERKLAIHDYGDIDYDRVWAAVEVHVPELIVLIGPLVPQPPAP